MQKKNFVKEKLRSGRPVLGIWSLIPNPTVLEIAGASGFDFQILDLEHGSYDFASLEDGIRTCESVGCSPLVRPPGLDASAIQKALDLGAHGIVVPQVQGHAEALAAVQATKYAPEGVRGFNPFTRAGDYRGGVDGPRPPLSNDFGLSSVIIETREAYEQLDRILAIPGLDLLYLGVYDMSVALGCPGDLGNPLVVEFLEASLPRIRKAGVAAGVMVKNQAEMERFLQIGANFLVYAVDTFVISNAMRAANGMMDQARKITGI